MNAEQVVNEITRRAWSFGVLVLISPKRGVVGSDGFVTGGCFDESVPSLTASACDTEADTLGLLLHEYSHLTQWVENCDVWRIHQKTPGDMWDWIGGKPVRGVERAIDVTRDMEADCERRTVRLIQELNAPIDIKDYTRKANAYIHFHNVIKAKRKWYKAPGALCNPEILRHCNETLDSDFRKTPKALFDALVKYAI